MRWEYTQPIYEVADRQVNIDASHGQAAATPARTATAARCTTLTTSSSNRASASPDTPTSKLVFRMGYAMSSFMEGTGANLRLPLNPPFFVETNVNYDPRTPGRHRNRLRGYRRPAGRSTGLVPAPNPYYQGRAWDPNLRPQFTQQYNAAIEYQFTNTTSMTAAYVGQLGTHLVVPHEANNPVPGAGPVSHLDSTRTTAVRSRLSLPNVGNIALTEVAAPA